MSAVAASANARTGPPSGTTSGNGTPASLAADLKKLTKAPSIPTFLYHIKPFYQREVETECARLTGLSLEVPKIDDVFQV